jgi:hypothetical protein
MKYRYYFMLLIAAAVGFMLWGCSSESQDPVSSVTTSAGGGSLKALHKAIAAPTNVLAVVNGHTVTITWDSLALAIDYHVVVQANGNPYIDTILIARQLVLTSVPGGSYTVTVAGILTGWPEGTASVPLSFTLSNVVAPTVTVTASSIPSCFRNGEWVTVIFSGIVVNSAGGANYVLKDEYNKIHYTGTVPAGPYSVKLKLKDRSLWFDKDGRQYTFTITAANSAGTAQASVIVTVPQDRKFRCGNDDDGWDDRH